MHNDSEDLRPFIPILLRCAAQLIVAAKCYQHEGVQPWTTIALVFLLEYLSEKRIAALMFTVSIGRNVALLAPLEFAVFEDALRLDIRDRLQTYFGLRLCSFLVVKNEQLGFRETDPVPLLMKARRMVNLFVLYPLVEEALDRVIAEV